MQRRAPRPFQIWLLSMLAAACGAGPALPGLQGLSLTLPQQVEGRQVTCGTCTPAAWGVVETSITVENSGSRDRRIATVESRVINRTRNAVIATNIRPNDQVALDVLVPRGGRAAIDVGVVYVPLPPPGDELWFAVVVTFDDGEAIGDQVRLFTR